MREDLKEAILEDLSTDSSKILEESTKLKLHDIVVSALAQITFYRNAMQMTHVEFDQKFEEIKAFCTQQIDTLWDEVKRLEYPHIYYVDYSEKLWLEQMRLLNEKQNG